MPNVKRSITLPRSLDRFVVAKAIEASRPWGNRMNYSAALAQMVERAKREDDVRAKKKSSLVTELSVFNLK